MFESFNRWRKRRHQAARTEAYYHHLRNHIDDLHRWCAEFPQVEAVATWLLERDRFFRGELKGFATVPPHIYDLREHLRGGRSIKGCKPLRSPAHPKEEKE